MNLHTPQNYLITNIKIIQNSSKAMKYVICISKLHTSKIVKLGQIFFNMCREMFPLDKAHCYFKLVCT